MPEVFDGEKKMIYTKLTGVKSEVAQATLEDCNGNKWVLQYEMGKPKPNMSGRYHKSNSLVFLVNGKQYDRKTMSQSIFSVIDTCMRLMLSRQNILKYMYIFPERVTNVYRDVHPGWVNGIIEINNHDDTVYKLHVHLGEFDYSKYGVQLKQLNKLTEWKITGYDANKQNPMMSMGLNIGIQLFDN